MYWVEIPSAARMRSTATLKGDVFLFISSWLQFSDRLPEILAHHLPLTSNTSPQLPPLAIYLLDSVLLHVPSSIYLLACEDLPVNVCSVPFW